MLTRRKFINLSATAAFSTAVVISTKGYGQMTQALIKSGSKKKGFGLSAKPPGFAEKLTSLQCKWFYNWTGNRPLEAPEGMEFIPLIRSRYAEAQKIADVSEQTKSYKVKDLLGFNEPDTAKQDNLTVDQALDLWPLLMESGLRLGSPACVHPDKEWMIQFMAGVKERKLRVDFVCIHSYGSPNTEALLGRLEKVHKMFELPLWITEFAVGDWQAKSVEENKHDTVEVLRFMEKVLPKLDALDFLERYAWFPAKPTDPPLGTSALFDDAGVLTKLGECYRDA